MLEDMRRVLGFVLTGGVQTREMAEPSGRTCKVCGEFEFNGYADPDLCTY